MPGLTRHPSRPVDAPSLVVDALRYRRGVFRAGLAAFTKVLSDTHAPFNTIAFLASEGAGYITGQNLRVDGGLMRGV